MAHGVPRLRARLFRIGSLVLFCLTLLGMQPTGATSAAPLPISGPSAATAFPGAFCTCRPLLATYYVGTFAAIGSAYAVVDSAGTTRLIGQGGFVFDRGRLPDRFVHSNLDARVVAAAPSGLNTLVVDQYGHVATVDFGSGEQTHGEVTFPLRRPIVGLATIAGGSGYWLAASDGGIFTFGDAQFRGSTGGRYLNRPIVAVMPYTNRAGYWLVASDGGVFTFGSARFHGSTGNIRLARPIVGGARTPSGNGYWLLASDGGVFSFGDAHFYGSAAPRHLPQPAVNIGSTKTGKGYWITTADHQIFNYGDAFHITAP
jgi:hypothetical protein